MTETNRYLTCGVDNTIPLELQLFMWDCVDRLHEPKDYLQVFELRPSGSFQSITHTSEEPEYRMEYLIPSDAPITEKLYIIDDGGPLNNAACKRILNRSQPFMGWHFYVMEVKNGRKNLLFPLWKTYRRR